MAARIQKFLADRGIASRRQIERWVKAGDILVDNEECTPGQHVTGDEEIIICGKRIDFHAEVETRVLLYHKPVGVVVTRTDPQRRPTIFDWLPALPSSRWVSVGRLDINTSGLLLLTTSGVLANDLMHPRNQIEREYNVRVYGRVTDEVLSRLQRGVQLDDGLAKMEILEVLGSNGANTWCRVVLKEGRKREVRRLWESQGLQVSRLIRTRFGTVKLPKELRQGKWLELPAHQVRQLHILK